MRRRGATIMELLLATCFLSISLMPLLYLFNLTKKIPVRSESEFLATLLAQHVMEKIIGFCGENPDQLPSMSPEEPLVSAPDTPQNVSEYFREILGKTEGLGENDFPGLYWAMRQFKCQVDTYYLEDNLYKIIVYIFYEEGGQRKRVFLERLLSRAAP